MRHVKFPLIECAMLATCVLVIGCKQNWLMPDAGAGSAHLYPGSNDVSDEEEAGETGALDAMEQRRLARLDDDGEIKLGSLLRAKAISDAMPVISPSGQGGVADAGIWNWTSLGPGNIGGRVRAICFTNDTTIYLGSVSGGIWKSTNTGGTWTPLTDFIASLAITSIVVDPNDSTRLFASTGEGFGNNGALPGAGVFRTADSGATWQQLPETSAWTYTNRLAFAEYQGSTYLFAATNNGVYRSSDGGNHWSRVLNTNALDVKVNGSRVLIGSKSDAFLYTFTDDTFARLTTGANGMLPNDTGRCEMAFGANGAMWASLDRNNGEVWHSTNSGTVWTLRNATTNYLCESDLAHCQGGYDNTIWASPDDPNLVVVGGIYLWRSLDSGFTFTQINDNDAWYAGLSAHTDEHAIVAPPSYGPSDHRLFFGNDGGIQSTIDIYAAGQTFGWINRVNNLVITQFYGGAVDPLGMFVLGGAQDVGTSQYRPSEGPNAWLHPLGADGGRCAINYNNPAIQYAEFQRLHLKKSTDFGLTFSAATTGLVDAQSDDLAQFIGAFVMDPSDPNNLAAGATSIWYTTTAADFWFPIRGPVSGSPKCNTLRIAATNSNRVWVGYTDGRVSRTTTDLTSWIDVNGNGPTPLPSRSINDIAINPTNSNEVFVAIGGYVNDSVWYTNDNGASWQQRTGSGDNILPPAHVNTLSIHPLNTNWIYVGTDLGIYASEDKGLTWNRTPRYSSVDNDGPVNTEVAELFWQGDDYLLAASYGRGMWRTRPFVVVHVDEANAGIEDGSAAHPFNTVQEGIAAAGNGTTISIRTGDYHESGTTRFSKRGRVVAASGSVRIH